MEGKLINTGSSSQEKIISGVVETVDAIKTTIGPAGKGVAIMAAGYPEITRDGATVAKSIHFSDQAKDIGAQMVKNAASLTEEQAGDGPQPLYAKVLALKGWTTMGELKVGDVICGTKGTMQEVVAIFHKGDKEVCRVKLAEGQVVECCEDHLWTVTTEDGSTSTMTLKKIMESGILTDDGKPKYFTPQTMVEYPKGEPSTRDLFEDSQVIGAGIGRDYIPKDYLFSVSDDRKALLNNLVGNYGKKTETGLIKYLTGSEKLGNDLVELMRSLGMSAKIEKAGELYSVSQVENNTLGTAIIGVEKTGVLTEMMCIKVSNPDNLYITNDYVVTHNTSTTSILIKELCLRGRKAVQTGSNVNEVKSGMLKAGKWMNEYIKKSATPINGDFDLIGKVATISANNDPEVGNLVVQGMKKVGMDGLLTADLAIGLDTQIDITSGMKLGKGWSSPQYVTDPATGECIMENPYILVAGEKLSSVNQIVPLMNALINSGTGRPILIVCDSIDDVVNTTLVLNVLRGAVRCCVVQGIDFGDNRKNTMNDLAVATGGAYICQENGLTVSGIELDNLGGASKVVVNKDSCVIYEGFGDPDEVTKLADLVKTRMKDPQLSDYEKTKFEKRLANLTGGIAIIKAGGATESEKMNRKATIEDSILAAKSAIEEGFVPGGGYVYLKGSELVEKDKAFWKSLSGDEVDGAKIVFSSLPIVMKTIAENSGKSGDVVLEEASHKKKDNIGYNAKTKKFGDLLEDGILDSTKVIRVALENSISTASMILLIDCTIIDEEDNKE